MKSSVDVIKAMEKAVAGLGGLIFLLFVISQFNAFFTYTNMATLAAVKMGDALEAAGLGALPLLLGFVFVVGVLDLIMTGAIPKWAIFAPIFVPLLMRLGVDARSGAGRLPCGRFADQFRVAAERVLRADRGVRAGYTRRTRASAR